jgi:uncharacterized protein (TIGR02145 family)
MIFRNLRLTMRHRLRFVEANSRVVKPGNGNQSNVGVLSKQNLMKKSMLLLIAFFIFISVALKAQSPQKINFQSIVRNTSGVIVSNKSVNFKVTILSGSTSGTPVYSETHLKTTDAIGLVSLQIGTGTVSSGVFSSIDWGNAVHFIKLEADFTGGNTYVTLGTQELMSVPYAMYAAKTDTASLNLTNRFADKAPVNNPTFTGTVGGITKAMVVGLENVDNTSDVDKPVSTATQTALDTKFNKADFPRGNKPGEFLYWNVQNWQSFEPGSPGQTIIIDQSGNPTWGCIVTNSADTASSNPTVTVNSPLTPITIATKGATGIFPAQYLPQGVTAAWSANVITISGTPAAAGTFNYTIPLTGGCGKVDAQGTITVVDASVPGDVVDVVVTDGLEEGEVIVTFSPPLSDGGSPIIEYEVEATEEVPGVNSPTISSYSQKNVLIENSTITSNDIPLTMAEDTNEPVSGFVVSSIIRTKGLKSPITVKGLKISVSYIFKVFAKNLIGSSPPPSSGKTQKFTPKLFLCAAGSASSSPSLIQNTALTNITHKTTKATGIGSASGLPQGVTAAWSGNTITISGTPTAAGVFNYTIPITGLTCNNVNATGTITVNVPPCGSNITYNGYDYKTVGIGTQCWMAENLRTDKYNDGTVINNETDNSGWGGLTTGARTEYVGGDLPTTGYVGTYGYLYNWYAVTDSKKLCPSGWHVPTDAEWTTLTTFLEGTNVAGGKMKSTGTTYWEVQKVGTDNSSGFSGLPGGYRFSDGSFRNIKNGAYFWSATAVGSSNAWERRLGSLNGDVFKGFSNNSFGYSVRCLRD